MVRFKNFLKVIQLLIVISLLIVFHYYINIQFPFFFFIKEALVFFILSNSILIATDFSLEFIDTKIRNNLILSSIYSFTAVIFTIIKWQFDLPFVTGIINYLMFFGLSLIVIVRDRFFYYFTDDKYSIFHFVLPVYFIIAKVIFNIVYIFNNEHTVGSSLLMLFAFIFGIYVVRAFINAFFVTGYLEYEGREYVIYDKFKIGRSRSSDIIIEENSVRKPGFQLFSRSGKFYIKPSSEVEVERNVIDRKTRLQEGDTIKLGDNYFTLLSSGGPLIKRFFLVFFLVFQVCLLMADTENIREYLEMRPNHYDFSAFPEVVLYPPLEGNNTNFFKEKVFIIEHNRVVDKNNVRIKDSFNIDLVLVIDVTSQMDRYYRQIHNLLENLIKSMGDNGKMLRVSIVTFADRKEDMQTYPFTNSIFTIDKYFNQITHIHGGDYEENPFDALENAANMPFQDDAMRVIYLITNASPHIKGDRGDEGVKDFTEHNAESVRKIIDSNSCLLLLNTYSMHEIYSQLIDDDTFFYPLDEVKDMRVVFSEIERQLINQFKLSYISDKRAVDKEKVRLYLGDSALYQKRNFFYRKNRRNSFMESLFFSF